MRKSTTSKDAFTSRRYRELMQNDRFECYRHIDSTPSEDVAICPHHHAFYEVIFVVDGEIYYEVEGRGYHLKRGDIILIDELQFHYGYIRHSKSYERYALWIHPKYMQLLSKRFPKLDPQYCFLQLTSQNSNVIHLEPNQFADLQNDLRHLFESYWSNTPSDEVLSESYFAIIMTKLNQIVHTLLSPHFYEHNYVQVAEDHNNHKQPAQAALSEAIAVADQNVQQNNEINCKFNFNVSTEDKKADQINFAKQLAAKQRAICANQSYIAKSTNEDVQAIVKDGTSHIMAIEARAAIEHIQAQQKQEQKKDTNKYDYSIDNSYSTEYEQNYTLSIDNAHLLKEPLSSPNIESSSDYDVTRLGAGDWKGDSPLPLVKQGEEVTFSHLEDEDEMHLNLKVSERVKLSPLLKYINSNIHEKLSLDDLAERFNLSKFYLTRRFKELTGLSLHQFIVKKRLTKARYLISVGIDPYRAAVDAGFNNYSHFSRTFKSYFGQNPSTIPQAREIHANHSLNNAKDKSTVASDFPYSVGLDKNRYK